MGILDGIRILDFTRLIAGPIATRILGDFGAEVIKVQSKRIISGMENPDNPFFAYLNRNKKSITLNLNKPDARKLLLKLCQISDVIVENFSPRVMENFGLSYEVLKSANPRIIMLSISSMGKFGPWRNFICFSHTFHALSGLTYLMSAKVGSPVQVGFSYGDVIAGLYAAIATVASILKRDITGRGEFIDLSGYEALTSLLGAAFLGDPCQGNKDEKELFPRFNCYRCKGFKSFCVVSVHSKKEMAKLKNLVGAKEAKTWEDLEKYMVPWMKKHRAGEIVKLFQRKGLKAEVVKNAKDIVKDKCLKERGFFTVLDKKLMINSPLRSIEDSSKSWRRAPMLGEHNKYVFCNLLGLDEEEFARYMKDGVIF